jgi:hypothetical protein
MRLIDLGPERRELIELFCKTGFGRIRIHIAAGQPVMDPRPVVLKEHKFGAASSVGRPTSQADFELKQQVIEFLEQIVSINDGVLDLEVQHGLPFRMTFQLDQ